MDVRDVTRHRGEFFRVLQQTDRSQTAVMTISPGEDAGRRCAWTARSAAWVPGARHHVRNPGRAPLFLVTIYAPPEY